SNARNPSPPLGSQSSESMKFAYSANESASERLMISCHRASSGVGRPNLGAKATKVMGRLGPSTLGAPAPGWEPELDWKVWGVASGSGWELPDVLVGSSCLSSCMGFLLRRRLLRRIRTTEPRDAADTARAGARTRRVGRAWCGAPSGPGDLRAAGLPP